MINKRILRKIYKRVFDRFYYLDKNTVELNNFCELKKIFGWTEDPILERDDIYDFDYIEDINEKRIRDAESIAIVAKNLKPKIAVEIGTSIGRGTVLISSNTPESKIYTVNIPPEEIENGQGGNMVTIALEREKIGMEYKKRNIKNIIQIFANTATWEPDIEKIDFAFIDGCHDEEFVYNDTIKMLKLAKKGTFILWHDFNLELSKRHDWIEEVCSAIERLYRKRLLKGKIYHIKDSWVGIYKVE